MKFIFVIVAAVVLVACATVQVSGTVIEKSYVPARDVVESGPGYALCGVDSAGYNCNFGWKIIRSPQTVTRPAEYKITLGVSPCQSITIAVSEAAFNGLSVGDKYSTSYNGKLDECLEK